VYATARATYRQNAALALVWQRAAPMDGALLSPANHHGTPTKKPQHETGGVTVASPDNVTGLGVMRYYCYPLKVQGWAWSSSACRFFKQTALRITRQNRFPLFDVGLGGWPPLLRDVSK